MRAKNKTSGAFPPFRRVVSPLFVLLAPAMGLASGAAPDRDEGAESSESALQAIGPDAIVGVIGLGESVVVNYTKTPLYRVLRYHGTGGDHLQLKVTRAGIRAVDMRAWIARPNGSVIRSGSRGEVSADLDRDGDILLVVRHERLEDATVTMTLTGAHASHPLFDLPAWALGRDLDVPIDCTVNGAKAFHVDGKFRVEPGTATQPRAALSVGESKHL